MTALVGAEEGRARILRGVLHGSTARDGLIDGRVVIPGLDGGRHVGSGVG